MFELRATLQSHIEKEARFMKVCKVYIFAMLCSVVCLWLGASVPGNAAVRLNLHGTPFPSRLDWGGKAVNVRSSRRVCPLAEEQMVQPIVNAIAEIVERFHSSRTWVNGVNRASIFEAKSGFTINVARTKNSSYVMYLNRDALSKKRFEKILPAIFDCVNVSFGTQTAARDLLLFPPDGAHRATPLYSPAIGFYLVLD